MDLRQDEEINDYKDPTFQGGVEKLHVNKNAEN